MGITTGVIFTVGIWTSLVLIAIFIGGPGVVITSVVALIVYAALEVFILTTLIGKQRLEYGGGAVFFFAALVLCLIAL